MHLNRIVAEILEMLAYIVPGWEATFWTIQSTCSTVKAINTASTAGETVDRKPAISKS